RSRGAERQQLKVFLFAIALLPIVPLGDIVPLLDGGILLAVASGAVPVGVAVAILRYRLYDIDRVISRTLSYALLTTVLVGVYAAGVLGVGALLPGGSSDLLVAGATLAVAALFRPLRARIQGLVDRRFNRSRYDAGRLVEDFGRRLRDRVDLDEVAGELRGAAGRALQPRSVSLCVVAPRVPS
ncbi:MAG: hypothetical protein KY469_15375, partial [Actinobacteria bacterium]|nr:hypothetical protein [Actinomycetota bacterium]